MNVIYVVAGVMFAPDNKVLLVQRPANKTMPYYWEFPGGKIEPNEYPEEALCRELKEELGLEIDVSSVSPLTFATYKGEDTHLTLLFLKVASWKGEIKLLEGQPSHSWVEVKDAYGLQMPPANAVILDYLTLRG